MSRPVFRFPAARLGCRAVRGDLPDRLLEWGPMEEWMDIHLATCLACQADVGPGRLVGEAVGGTDGDAVIPAPDGFVTTVMERLDGPTTTEVRHRRAVVGETNVFTSAAGRDTIGPSVVEQGKQCLSASLKILPFKSPIGGLPRMFL